MFDKFFSVSYPQEKEYKESFVFNLKNLHV